METESSDSVAAKVQAHLSPERSHSSGLCTAQNDMQMLRVDATPAGMVAQVDGHTDRLTGFPQRMCLLLSSGGLGIPRKRRARRASVPEAPGSTGSGVGRPAAWRYPRDCSQLRGPEGKA